MSDEAVSEVAPDPATAAIAVMNEVHVELGRKAAEKAMEVLDALNIADIPVATAVALLKFGVELERKALLGVEADGPEVDPFAALAKGMGGQPAPKTEEES